MKATILKSSPRYQTWLDVFGSDTVSVLGPFPVTARIEDAADVDGKQAKFYRLDVASLTTKQRKRVIQHLSDRWKLIGEEVVKLLDNPEHGLPILAEDIVVAMDLRLFT